MALWTPTLAGITRAIELNPFDSSTVTLTSGYVSQVNDISGNDRHAVQTDAALRPSISTAYWNGIDVLSYDGAGDYLTGPYNINAGSQSVFAAFLYSGGNSSQRIFTQAPTAVNDWQWSGFRIPILRNVSADQIDTEHAGAHIATQSAARDVPIVFSHIYNAATGTVSNRVFDGAEQTASHTNVATALNRYLIGNATDDSGRMLGKLACLLVIDDAVSDTLRSTIIGYMTWLIGAQEYLAADHAFKTAAPEYGAGIIAYLPEVYATATTENFGNVSVSPILPVLASTASTENFGNVGITPILPAVNSLAVTENASWTRVTPISPVVFSEAATQNLAWGRVVSPKADLSSLTGSAVRLQSKLPSVFATCTQANMAMCDISAKKPIVNSQTMTVSNVAVRISPPRSRIFSKTAPQTGYTVIKYRRT